MALKEILENFIKLTNTPTNYLSTNDDLTKRLKENLKAIYDFIKEEESKLNPLNTLRKLLIKNFDCEQIYQQLEIQNEAVFDFAVPEISKLLSIKSRLKFKNASVSDEEKDSGHDEEDDEQSEENNERREEKLSTGSDDSMSESSDDHSEEEQDYGKKKSAVDDDFFKLDEMEEFLNHEEKNLSEKDKSSDDDSDEELKKVDFFKNDDDFNDDRDSGKSKDNDFDPRVAKFKDFFGKKNTSNERKRPLDDSLEDQVTYDKIGDTDNIKSNLELRQNRLNKKIKTIEDQSVAEKPWQMKGEITGDQRPKDSLLEDLVDYDITTRPAPIITQETSLQLEDIIKQRIKNKVFDSVERKIKPIETPLEFKKRLLLDQEKSKLSLAQIYEKEYQDQQAKLDPEFNEKQDEEEPPLNKEIKQLMSNLFRKLDALSNYHFTAAPPVPDIKIISNLPTVVMEEVAPVLTSNATLLAPEEVKRKLKGDVIGKSERTTTDKNRERRKKKMLQKKHKKLKEQKEEKKGSLKQSRLRKVA